MSTLMTFHRRSIVLLVLCVLMWSGTVAAQGNPDDVGTASPQALAPLVLQEVWTAPDGTEAVFIIGMVSIQEVVDRTGVFVLAPAEEMEDFSELAVVVHYTMLSSSDEESGEPTVFVRALAVDFETGMTLPGARWEALYLLTPSGAIQLAGDDVDEPYADLVEPSWLVDWSVTAEEDLPKEELHVGDEWWGASRLDQLGADVPLSDFDSWAMGTFIGWTDGSGAPGPEALIGEHFGGTASGREELFDGVDGIFTLDVEGIQHYWLVPGTFPTASHKVLVGSMTMYVGPESGAPAGVEGSVEIALEYEQTIEQLGLDDFPWADFYDVDHEDPTDGETTADGGADADTDDFDVFLSEFEELNIGIPATGVLGAWSEDLGDGTYADYYTFFGLEGETIVVDLISRDFDAFLLVFDDEWNNLAYDDDSGGGTDARLTYTLPYTGTYIVVANAYYEGESGMYTLLVDVWEPEEIDFDRAVNLIGMLSIDYPLSDAELEEAETLLLQLLELIQSLR